jgi:hypothetical protein
MGVGVRDPLTRRRFLRTARKVMGLVGTARFEGQRCGLLVTLVIQSGSGRKASRKKCTMIYRPARLASTRAPSQRRIWSSRYWNQVDVVNATFWRSSPSRRLYSSSSRSRHRRIRAV